MRKIFITRPIPGPAQEMLRSKGFEVKVNPKDQPLSEKQLVAELKKGQYDGVISLLNDKLYSKVFDAAPTVRIYSNYAVGYNNIDIEEAKRRNIAITNTPSDLINESVAEHTFAMILALSSRIVEGDKYVRAGKYKGWEPNLLIGVDLKGRTLGVIGAGRIGSYVIEKAVRGFSMKVLYYDVVKNERIEREFGAVRKDTVDEIMREADVVSLHCFLDESTKHLINRERLALMKQGAIIVNTARGPVIDEKALIEALKAGRISAGLDVFEDETKISKALYKFPNVVLTPHIASSTENSRNEMSRLAAEAIIDFFEGRKPVHLVQ